MNSNLSHSNAIDLLKNNKIDSFFYLENSNSEYFNKPTLNFTNFYLLVYVYSIHGFAGNWDHCTCHQCCPIPRQLMPQARLITSSNLGLGHRKQLQVRRTTVSEIASRRNRSHGRDHKRGRRIDVRETAYRTRRGGMVRPGCWWHRWWGCRWSRSECPGRGTVRWWECPAENKTVAQEIRKSSVTETRSRRPSLFLRARVKVSTLWRTPRG